MAVATRAEIAALLSRCSHCGRQCCCVAHRLLHERLPHSPPEAEQQPPRAPGTGEAGAAGDWVNARDADLQLVSRRLNFPVRCIYCGSSASNMDHLTRWIQGQPPCIRQHGHWLVSHHFGRAQPHRIENWPLSRERTQNISIIVHKEVSSSMLPDMSDMFTPSGSSLSSISSRTSLRRQAISNSRAVSLLSVHESSPCPDSPTVYYDALSQWDTDTDTGTGTGTGTRRSSLGNPTASRRRSRGEPGEGDEEPVKRARLFGGETARPQGEHRHEQEADVQLGTQQILEDRERDAGNEAQEKREQVSEERKIERGESIDQFIDEKRFEAASRTGARSDKESVVKTLETVKIWLCASSTLREFTEIDMASNTYSENRNEIAAAEVEYLCQREDCNNEESFENSNRKHKDDIEGKEIAQNLQNNMWEIIDVVNTVQVVKDESRPLSNFQNAGSTGPTSASTQLFRVGSETMKSDICGMEDAEEDSLHESVNCREQAKTTRLESITQAISSTWKSAKEYVLSTFNVKHNSVFYFGEICDEQPRKRTKLEVPMIGCDEYRWANWGSRQRRFKGKYYDIKPRPPIRKSK